MTVLMAAGGTGGHLIPAIVVADELKKKLPDSRIIFAGTGKELERKILSGTPYSNQIFEGAPLVGQGIFRRFHLAFFFLPRLFRTAKILGSCQIRVVVGFGGYPSVMPVLAAWLLGIPGIIFEQNGQAGVANRVLSLIADRVFAVPGSSLSARGMKYITNPVRSEIKEVCPWKLPSNDAPMQILVLGGSQGAVRVNTAVVSMIPMLAKYSVKILHQTGERDFERVQKAYEESGIDAEIVPYITNMKKAYEQSHFIICRAGAGSVSEILTSRRPAIFIPLAISHGHQYFNVKELVSHGAALHVSQDDSLDISLKNLVQSLLESPSRLQDVINALDSFYKDYSFRDGADALTEAVLELYEK